MIKKKTSLTIQLCLNPQSRIPKIILDKIIFLENVSLVGNVSLKFLICTVVSVPTNLLPYDLIICLRGESVEYIGIHDIQRCTLTCCAITKMMILLNIRVFKKFGHSVTYLFSEQGQGIEFFCLAQSQSKMQQKMTNL